MAGLTDEHSFPKLEGGTRLQEEADADGTVLSLMADPED